MNAVPERFNIVTDSPRMHEIFNFMDKVMDSEEPVLIQGESGTGKELVARAFHFYSKRRDRVLLSENCAAIANSLLESELFGHTKGAFTGADNDRKGMFELAQGGTIFLDEIGDTTMDLQKKLLRVLQENEFRKVGGECIVKLIGTRIIAATNKDLKELARSGMFRNDLFYRLNVILIKIPPLRERREDIPLLVKYFITFITGEACSQKIQVSEDAMQAMMQYDWPGNIRELENEIKRALLIDDRHISLDNLSDSLKSDSKNVIKLEDNCKDLKKTVAKIVREVECKMILNILNQLGWNKAQAARDLGLSREGLRQKMIKYKLDRRK